MEEAAVSKEAAKAADTAAASKEEPKTEAANVEPTTDATMEEPNAEAAEEQDEFSYLQRSEFTSEKYKIEVRNLGYFGIGEFRKLLKTKLQLDLTKIKSPSRKEYAFVCFRSQEDQERAIELLNGYKWKGKELKAFAAKASADPLMKRRREEQAQSKDTQAKKFRTSAEATCPLASLPYDEQLEQKTDEMKTLVEEFTEELKEINPMFKDYMKAFEFEGVEPSPVINGYRNKNEFAVGKNADDEVVVGFRLGSYADGSVEVAEVQALPHIPEAAQWAAKSFQEFVRQSKLVPFNPELNSGHFRQLMVRTSAKTGEIMLVPGLYCSNLTDAQLQELQDELKEFYEKYDSTTHKCTSLYYQDVKHREVGQIISPVTHISGTTHIADTILGLNFRISPLAFFQVNTQSANVLYQRIIDLAAPKPYSTVLDICCGTGTISLAFAKHCKQVLGVDIIPDAIRDARFNADANDIENCKFYTGNADDYIQSMVKEVCYGTAPHAPLDIIAVVDPPRAGLHNRSIAAIRAAVAVKRLIYVSCNPSRAQRNWLELGRPPSKMYKGDPFFPKTAVAVDMFPHTIHTEMIVLFERAGSDSEAAAEERPKLVRGRAKAAEAEKKEPKTTPSEELKPKLGKGKTKAEEPEKKEPKTVPVEEVKPKQAEKLEEKKEEEKPAEKTPAEKTPAEKKPAEKKPEEKQLEEKKPDKKNEEVKEKKEVEKIEKKEGKPQEEAKKQKESEEKIDKPEKREEKLVEKKEEKPEENKLDTACEKASGSGSA